MRFFFNTDNIFLKKINIKIFHCRVSLSNNICNFDDNF